MSAELTPMRWPASWKDPAALRPLGGTAINCLLIENLPEIESSARAAGIRVGQPDRVSTVPGLWPGIRLSQSGGNSVTSGPMGVPWVDSNGEEKKICIFVKLEEHG